MHRVLALTRIMNALDAETLLTAEELDWFVMLKPMAFHQYDTFVTQSNKEVIGERIATHSDQAGVRILSLERIPMRYKVINHALFRF